MRRGTRVTWTRAGIVLTILIGLHLVSGLTAQDYYKTGSRFVNGITVGPTGLGGVSGNAGQTTLNAPDGGAYLIESNGVIGINSGTLYLMNGGSGSGVISTTAPTVTSAGTSPAMAGANGTATFRVNVGTGGTATTIVMAMPAGITNGWNCDGSNLTAAAANRNPTGVLLQQASTNTSVTMQYQTVGTGVALAFAISDIVKITCMAF